MTSQKLLFCLLLVTPELSAWGIASSVLCKLRDDESGKLRGIYLDDLNANEPRVVIMGQLDEQVLKKTIGTVTQLLPKSAAFELKYDSSRMRLVYFRANKTGFAGNCVAL